MPRSQGWWVMVVAAGCFTEPETIPPAQGDSSGGEAPSTASASSSGAPGDGGTAGDAADSTGQSDAEPDGSTTATDDGPSMPPPPIPLFPLACPNGQWSAEDENAMIEITGCVSPKMPVPGFAIAVPNFPFMDGTAPALHLTPKPGGDILGLLGPVDVAAFSAPRLVVDFACPPEVACTFDWFISVGNAATGAVFAGDQGTYVGGAPQLLTLPFTPPEGTPIDFGFQVLAVGDNPDDADQAIFIDPKIVDAPG
ncbi:MAG: hypothetical protein AAF721_21525 [Myxococcota bacterium]